ncbi:tetratricopeptide repeat protein [Chelativorans sp. YIM 93263]|uniref:tetratricopeptide repeat protein n=1 Tax=Chelativorans sp. YIM 93263 TaxID=2906648 RepID=UPI0023796A2F|nr:tetratricopeptide repeat protein [Chelativorans sp. YIM 93263]
MKRFLVILLPLVFFAGSPLAWGQGETDEKASRPGSEDSQAGESVGETDNQSPVDPARFGKTLDKAFGAYQRGHYLTALEHARPRAEAGDPAAQALIAEIYARGLGVPRSAEKAAEWYAKAAEQGVPEAQMQYALILADGELVERDRDKAFSLMRSAARAGETMAQFNLAQMLLESGAEDEAVEWYERAAEAGLADAQYSLAQISVHGAGNRKPDEAEARRWLLRAARQNYDTAQLDLGTWLVEGRGGDADPEQGFAWLKRAAEGGNVAAQNRLAKLYRAGIGTEPDAILAAAWYMLARRAGLEDFLMEDFLHGLTEEQLEQAATRADSLR